MANDSSSTGIKGSLDKEVDGLFPRPLAAYDREATEKGWQQVLPRKGQPRVYLSGGANLLPGASGQP